MNSLKCSRCGKIFIQYTGSIGTKPVLCEDCKSPKDTSTPYTPKGEEDTGLPYLETQDARPSSSEPSVQGGGGSFDGGGASVSDWGGSCDSSSSSSSDSGGSCSSD